MGFLNRMDNRRVAEIQVGKGSGRTLATVAGVLGGGYIGNEIAKRNP